MIAHCINNTKKKKNRSRKGTGYRYKYLKKMHMVAYTVSKITEKEQQKHR
jgi:hypothetical protein